MKTPLYSGETPAISRVPEVQIPSTHPMQRTWDANAARATENAYALENALVDRLEYTRQQELEAAETQLNADIKADLDTTLQLANGAPGSLFDKDGKPNKAAIQSFTSRYTARLADFDKGFITPQSRQTAALAKASLTTGIGNTIRATVAASLKPRATAAFKVNYELAIKQGLTQKAHNAAKSLLDAGFCTPEEYTLYCMDADEKGIDYQLDHIQSFEQGDALYNNPDFTRKLNTRQLRQLENTLDSYAAQSIAPATVLKIGRKPGSTNPADYEKTTPLPPAGLPYFMQDIYVNNNGDFSTKNLNGRIEATKQLYNWALAAINPDDPYNVDDENLFRAQTDIFKIEADAVTRTLKEVRAAITDTSAPSLEAALKNIPGHLLYKRMPQSWVEDLTGNGLAESDDDAIKQFFDIHHPGEYTAFKNSGLTLNQWYDAQEKAKRAAITSDYSAWIGNGKNSSNSPEIKISQIDATLRKHLTEHAYLTSRISLEPFINQVRQTELDRIARKEKHGKTRSEIIGQTIIYDYAHQIEARNAANETPTFHSLSYADRNITALPYSTTAPFIYVPKGFAGLGKAGTDVPVVDPSSGKPIAARIMEVEGITTPTISSVLSRLFRLYKRKGAPLSITKAHGNIFITQAPETESNQQTEQGTTPTYGDISQNNQLLPDWAESQLIDDTAEEAVSVSHAYPTGPLPI